MPGVPIKRGYLNRETDMHKGKMMWRHRGRRRPCGWSDASISQGMPRIVSKPETSKSKKRFSRAVRKSTALLTPWFCTSSLQNRETIKLYRFNPLSFWYVVMAALENWQNMLKEIRLFPSPPPNPVLFPVLYPTGRAQNQHFFLRITPSTSFVSFTFKIGIPGHSPSGHLLHC